MLAGAVPSGHVSRVEPSPPCRLMGSVVPCQRRWLSLGGGELRIAQCPLHRRQPSPCGVTLSPVPPRNLRLGLAVSPVLGTLPDPGRERAACVPLHPHTLPAGSARQSRSPGQAGAGRLQYLEGGYQRGVSAMRRHCPQEVAVLSGLEPLV